MSRGEGFAVNFTPKKTQKKYKKLFTNNKIFAIIK